MNKEYEGIQFEEINPSARNIGLVAIKHFDKKICTDFELIEPNYVKYIKYKKNKKLRI